MKIFIDDIRKPNNKHSNYSEWTLVTSFEDFEKLLIFTLDKRILIEEISFDYILGYNSKTGKDCFSLLLEKYRKYGLDIPKIIVHSEYPRAEEYFQKVANTFNQQTSINIKITKI